MTLIRRLLLAVVPALLLGMGITWLNREKPAEEITTPAGSGRVALWQITDKGGTVRGYLFGTVHALPPKTQWLRPAITDALAASDRLVLEIAEPIDQASAGEALAELAGTAGLPPPSQRIAPKMRDDLKKVYKKLGLTDADFVDTESWAVALQLAAIAGEKAGSDPESGSEPALRRLAAGKPIVGFETLQSQFAVFDSLPPREQKVLLQEVTVEAASDNDEEAQMIAMWLRGDDLGIAREANEGFLADPGLHTALLTTRNRLWADQLDAMLKGGAKPFVAVGAAHLAGSDSLQRLMMARGWQIKRVP
ncbi:MAG: polysaccharide biosynthesis protein GumN [Novosphingobium sp. 17-62-19]|uniref:TraB/GumN family protein n=1 Tax=Novosphingobium sp. 17-62-19 TaxID=1970406 RepID=UPI000BCB0450|nr:TraB/GumN family protein [Novosphingobium sp. 17-62-19]OYX93895.1 MAG: polysaccharide biosynthesis protein GumN [Novosphingobium sp. 35-62-5]OZA19785.1 MAG: polysaccharide biosynthesis protein GumN [Novosphingobium sp. 17-62-19]HQS97495.1 TraB/GumN family protein [Novosphingobium sp.]